MRLGAVAAVGLLVALSGCTPDYVTDNASTVILRIVAINDAAPLYSDVRNGEFSTFVCPDLVDVSVAVRNKNPNTPAPNVPSAVFLKSYEVRYFRTDGRGTEGVDVPYRITGNLTLVVDVQNSGSTTFSLEVVRIQAKAEPPLSSIFQAAVLTVMADVTVYGETVSGQSVSSSGRVQINFADYGDKLTECKSK